MLIKEEFCLPWWSVILVLLHGSECAQTDRMQRRFMWKQMDDTMDDLFDSMASGARAMKNMIGELLPGMTTSTPLLMHSNVLDYLPSETTKVKYIIKGSSTHKPIKIIKMAAPKKVVKIMTVPKAIVESKIGKSKLHFPSAEALRQLEREQEILAEGRVPQYDNEDLKDSIGNNVVKGQINEFNSDWRPVSTAQPVPMSELHTSVLGEKLPEPEKIVYEPQANEVSYEYHKQKHGYEVTEHTPEETVAVPYTQTQYQNSRGFVPIRNGQQQQHQTHHQHNARFGLMHSTTSSTTTSTTESPNYPASFLKKQRERPLSLLQQHLKNLGVNESDVALISSKAKSTQKTHSLVRVKSESWPLLGPTIQPTISVANTTTKERKAEPLIQSTTVKPLRQKPTKKQASSQPRDIRQRGSIKFGDKLSELY